MLINDSGCETAINNRGKRFVSGVLLLSISTLVCKIIGLFFKIPIINIVGIEGMAYFSAAYNVYMLLNSIAAAGLPVALSIMISKNSTCGNKINVKKIFKVSLILFVVIGTCGTLLLFFGADWYSECVGISGASLAVKAIAPTILLITVSGALRGYFQGHEIMAPTAVSQLIESLGKLIFGISLSLVAIRKQSSLPYIAASAISGISLGVFISILYLVGRYFFFCKKRRISDVDQEGHIENSVGEIIGELFRISLPITLSSCLTSITSLADTALITNGLISSGYAENVAVALYSSYTNLAIPLFNLVPALVTPLAISLIPSITSSITRKNDKEATSIFSSSVKLCLAFSIPAAAGMAVFSKQILDLIYPNEPEACAFAAPLLSLLAIAIVFSCMTTVMNAVLQSYMKTVLPIVSMAIGATAKVILEYVLVRTDAGIMGAPISTVIGCLIIMLVDVVFVNVHTPHKLEIASFFKTLTATTFCIASAMTVYCISVYNDIDGRYSLILSIFVAVIVYAFSALKCGVVGAFEIGHLPFGKSIIPVLRKLKLIK